MSLKPIVFSYVETDNYTYSITKDIVFYHKSIEDAYVELCDLIEKKLKEYAEKKYKGMNWQEIHYIESSIEIKINGENIPISHFLNIDPFKESKKVIIDFELTELKEEMVKFD